MQQQEEAKETGAAAMSQPSPAAQSKNADAPEDEMIQVTASINVDDEIVRGTASVNQSVDSNPLDAKNGAGGMVKVQHYLQDEALPERAQSQLEHQLSRDALYVANTGDGAQTRNELRSGLTNAGHEDEDEVTADREEAKATDEGLAPEQLTETVHTMAANHTVPNTAGQREESDEWEERVQCEVGAAAMTEADRNISHGFSSDNVMMRSSQEGDPEHNLQPTETEKTGSQVMYNPGATGELEFDQQRVEDFFSAGNDLQMAQEPLIADDQESDQEDDQEDDQYEDNEENEKRDNQDNEDEDEMYSEDQDQVNGEGDEVEVACEEALKDAQHAAGEPEAAHAEAAAAIEIDNDQEAVLNGEQVAANYEETEEAVIAQEVAKEASQPELVEKETISEDKESQDQHESDIEIKSSKEAARAQKRVYVPATAKDTAVMDELERLVINLNHTAMANLKNDQFVMAKRLLFKAEQNLVQVDTQCAELQVTTDSISDLGDANFAKRAGIGPLDALKNRLMGLTYNNLGCLCKQQQDFKGALVYLKKALHFESRLEDYEEEERNLDDLMEADAKDLEFQQDLRTIQCNSAGTILNICAILSKLARHKQAQEYAEQAIQKLRHSMRLTKQQVMQAQRRISVAQDQLDQALQNAKEGEPADETSQANQQLLKEQLEKYEIGREDLENQWINLATTAVIAHYNAAVELEFTSSWREALDQYEKAMKLAALAMKDQNPMSAKIKQAIGKMRMKVRNKVQLPEKLVLQGGKKGRKGAAATQGKSYIGSNKTSAGKATGPVVKDWQTSVNSARSSQFNQQLQSLKSNNNANQVAPLSSNEFAAKDLDQSPGHGLNFHPNASLDTTDNQPHHQISSFDNSHTRESMEGSTQIAARKVGLRTVVKARHEQKSPISLKKIINKLELTEKQETAKQLQPKSKFRPQRVNPLPSYRANSSTQQPGEETSTMSVLRERQHGYLPGTALHSIRTTSVPGGRISRNCAQRNTINSAGVNGFADANFLPSLATTNQMNGTTGFHSTRNNRGGTVQGGREAQTPLNQHIERIISTGLPKTMRSVQQKPLPGVNAPTWGWGTLPATIDESGTTPLNINVKETTLSSLQSVKQHRRAGTIDASSSNPETNRDLNLSPTRLQMHLSVAQERRLIEQGKRLGATKSKREQDINFFLGHIKKQGMAATKGKGKLSHTHRMASPAVKMTERVQMPADLASVRAQVIMEATAAQLAGSAYLPSKLKKTLKQRQYVSQIKTMQKQLVKEQQLDLNSQLETAFQKEMAAWKTEREHQLGTKLRELAAEQERQQKALYLTTQQQTSTLSDEDARSSTAPAGATQLFYQGLSDDQAKAGLARLPSEPADQNFNVAGEVEQRGDAMSAEQAQEARSIQQDSNGTNENNKLGEAGPSVDQDEEEVGNFRVSPHPPQIKSKVVGQEGVEHGQMSIMDENDGHIRPLDTPQEERELGTGTGQSSQVPVSEYVSSMQNITNEQHQPADALSGTQCQEVELDRRSNKQTENLEVEDVVSADTNNAAHNFQSYRTSSNVFRGDGAVVGQDELYKNRMNAESALQYASTQGAVGHDSNRPQFQNSRTGARIHNAKSQLEVTSNFDQVGDPAAILRAQHDSMAAVPPTDYNADFPHEQDDQLEQQDAGARVRASQAGASSIEGSQVTETVMTLKSEYADGMNIIDNSTLHEDTIAGWRANRATTRPGSRLMGPGTPDLTDGQQTVICGKTSQIGDGPIFIKKSTDFHTSNRRIKHIDSISSLGGTMGRRTQNRHLRQVISNQVSKDRNLHHGGLSRPDSRQASDITCTTLDINYNDSRIMQAKRISLGADSAQLPPPIASKGPDSLQQNSIMQKSELARKHPSGLSMEEESVQENISQATEVVLHHPETVNLRVKKSSKQQQKSSLGGEITPAAMNVITSGQTSLGSGGAPGVPSFNMNQVDDAAMAMVTPSSYMTPRPGQMHAVIKKETAERHTLERSSQDTEKVQKKAPKNIQYSRQTKKRTPVAGGTAITIKAKNAKSIQQNVDHMRYVASMASAPPKPSMKKQQSTGATSPLHGRQQKMAAPPSKSPKRAAEDKQQQQQAPMPAMIHTNGGHQQQNAANYVTARSAVCSPQYVSNKRMQKGGNGGTMAAAQHQMQIVAKSGDHREAVTANKKKQQQEAADRTNTPLDSMGMQKTEVVMDYTYIRNDEGDINSAAELDDDDGDAATENAAVLSGGATGTEDRVAKIAQKISKLNTTLLQFQKENEETRKDPTLKSTHRSTASKQGLMSQKSRDTYMTMPAMAQAMAVQQQVSVPQEVRQMQDQRALAQLQSAPGRSRVPAQMQREDAEGDRDKNSALSASASQHEPTTAQGPQQPQMINIDNEVPQDEASIGAETFTPRNITSPATQDHLE